ncbi:MAG: hypothetical protein J6C62_01055, partial [Clostridia bacterium]|nr:hypothetical protein [Clostridia bacterium]
MKKFFSILIAIFLFLAPLVTGCELWSFVDKESWKTNLSTEEHYQNIVNRTEEKFAQELSDGTIEEYRVYTVYNFSNQPEYFLVELKYSEPKTLKSEVRYVNNYKNEKCAIHGVVERFDFFDYYEMYTDYKKYS